MALTTKQTMAQPTPTPFDLNTAIYVIGSCITGLIAWVYFVNAYFKSKSREKEEWIKQIATAAVNAAMDSCLKDVRDDIKVLFKYREEDRKHIDHKFDMMVTEIRK